MKVKKEGKSKIRFWRGIKSFFKNIFAFFWREKYWALGVLIILVVFLIWQLTQSWVFKSFLAQTETYSRATVLGGDVGGLSANQLSDKIAEIKSDFETKKITLTHGKDQWVFDFSKLGKSMDAEATRKAVLKLNDLNLIDKYRLMTGDISGVVEPVITTDSNKCIEALSTIVVPQTEPKDALIYFDQEVKIKPDESGAKFNAALTCQDLSKSLATNSFTLALSMDVIAANMTGAMLEPKLSQIQSLVGKSVALKLGSYQKNLTSEQLLALIDITKNNNEAQVSWSSGRLDELVNGVAADVNTYNSAPALGACQNLISSGGNWLDKTATKNIFMNLGSSSPRIYNLSVTYYGPVVRDITPVSISGSSGTVYLTFDDGMTYANQIMNYAACYGVKVTFFELGSRVGVDAVALKRAINEGHAVQSHGHEHAVYDYGSRSYDWQYNDMATSISEITGVTGVRPTYFRPPGGNRSSTTYTAASANGLNLILWGVSSIDTVATSNICSNVLSGAFDGASVLMHSTKQSTANAIPCIIEGLAARGYNMKALR